MFLQLLIQIDEGTGQLCSNPMTTPTCYRTGDNKKKLITVSIKRFFLNKTTKIERYCRSVCSFFSTQHTLNYTRENFHIVSNFLFLAVVKMEKSEDTKVDVESVDSKKEPTADSTTAVKPETQEKALVSNTDPKIKEEKPDVKAGTSNGVKTEQSENISPHESSADENECLVSCLLSLTNFLCIYYFSVQHAIFAIKYL